MYILQVAVNILKISYYIYLFQVRHATYCSLILFEYWLPAQCQLLDVHITSIVLNVLIVFTLFVVIFNYPDFTMWYFNWRIRCVGLRTLLDVFPKYVVRTRQPQVFLYQFFSLLQHLHRGFLLLCTSIYITFLLTYCSSLLNTRPDHLSLASCIVAA